MTHVAAEGVIDIYQDNAAAWIEARETRFIEQHWLDLFFDTLSPGGRSVLDLGCGAGRAIAAYLAGRGCRITGVDGAAALIAAARLTLPAHK